jgi:hypothetical protein
MLWCPQYATGASSFDDAAVKNHCNVIGYCADQAYVV